MRAPVLLFSVSLFAAMPVALNAMADTSGPGAVRQETNDPWDIGATSLKAPCQRILSEVAFPVPMDIRDKAEVALQTLSVVPLDEGQASALMGRPTTGHVFADLLIEKVNQIQAQKKSTVNDQLTAHDLIQAVGPHYPPYRPYLIRALAGAGISPANFSIRLCGDTVLVDNTSGGDKAMRVPMIVFLQAKPVTALPSWYSSGK